MDASSVHDRRQQAVLGTGTQTRPADLNGNVAPSKVPEAPRKVEVTQMSDHGKEEAEKVFLGREVDAALLQVGQDTHFLHRYTT